MSKLNKIKKFEISSSPCHFTKRKYRGLSKRKTTEKWLKEVSKREGFEFKYFLTLSFYKAQTSVISQYIDNVHIKKVLIDFFYPNKKPINRIRFWFFVERHLDNHLHLHILMEGLDSIEWLSKRNRKIIISKRTILDIVHGNYSIEEVMIEAVTHHLQAYVLRLGTGKQGVDMRKVGDIKRRIQYVNKSLEGLDFNCWDHIDWENSDLEAMQTGSI